MKKLIALSIALALGAQLYAEDIHIFRCSEDGIPGQSEPQLMGFSMSANGRYICGTIEQGSGFFVADSFTGEVKWKFAGEESGSELRNVDDNGLSVGFIDDNGVLFSFETEDISELKVPSGYRYVLGECMSNDGSVMVGELTSRSFDTMAAYSIGGEAWSVLPNPSDAELGNLKEHISNMSAAKFVSGDGSVIMGHLGSFTFPMVWIKNQAGEYVPDFFPARYVKTDENDATNELYNISAMYTCMSNNGKYVGAVGLIMGGPYDEFFVVPVIYNTEEMTLKVYKEWQDIDEYGVGLYPRAIADDGTFIGTVGQPQTSSTGSFIMRAGHEQAELFVDAFPAYAEKLGLSDEAGYNVPTGISADGNHILGYTYYSDDLEMSSDAPAYYLTYVISLDGTGVDLIDGNAMVGSEAVYSIDGRRLSGLTKGLNIVRNADGTVTKIMK